MGQPDTTIMSSDRFILAGGLWQSGVMVAQHRIYLSVVLRQFS
jgi:hypothetical protein